MMVTIPVVSSCVESIGYDFETGDMEVVFIKTGPYVYHGVPQDLYESFLDAPSKGEFANKVLKQGAWEYTRGPAVGIGI